MRDHCALGRTSCTGSVGESQAILGVDFVFLVVVIKWILLADLVQALKGHEPHSSFFEIVHLVLRKLIETDQSIDLNEIFALCESLQCAVIDEASGELRVLKDISDVLVP